MFILAHRPAFTVNGVHQILLPLENRAILSWMIESIPEETEIIITHRPADALVRDYLAAAHRNRRWTAIEVGESVPYAAVVEANAAYITPDAGASDPAFSQFTDITSRERYEQYHALQHTNHSYDYRKDGEFFYQVNDRIIKIFSDPTTAANRVSRASMHSAFPQLCYIAPQLYAYEFVPGRTFYQDCSVERFQYLLTWLRERLWPSSPASATLTEEDCVWFYKHKTYARLREFRTKYPNFHPTQINRTPITQTLEEYLDAYDWAPLITRNLVGRCGFIHGDLQFDNLLWTDRTIVAIDWRQDFAGHLDYGDIYYDVAKLKAGLLLNHDLIKRHLFSFTQNERGQVAYDYARRIAHDTLREIVDANFADPIIDDIVTLIYLNMAPLHAAPYDKLLFSIALERLATRHLMLY